MLTRTTSNTIKYYMMYGFIYIQMYCHLISQKKSFNVMFFFWIKKEVKKELTKQNYYKLSANNIPG